MKRTVDNVAPLDARQGGEPAERLRAALLTPGGEGGISVVALWGRGAAKLAERRLAGGRGTRRRLSRGRLTYGFFRDENGERIDEVIVACVNADFVEVNCHGGIVPAGRVLGSLAAEGVAIEKDGALPRLMSAGGLIEREALEALISARTDLGARVFAGQAGGLLRRALEEILGLLADAGKGDAALGRLRTLLQSAHLGMALANPASVAIAGPANAGKSSLINALAGYERNIVTDVPGTTRDAVRVEVSLSGIPAALTDTAGAGMSGGALDAEAGRRATAAAERADAAVFVIDASGPLPVGYAPARKSRAIVAANKADLPANKDTLATMRGWGMPVVSTSALAGEGLAGLTEAILAVLGADVPVKDAALRATVFTKRQLGALQRAIAAVEKGDIAGARGAIIECLG
jgi:tRNA modification GTPase